MIPCPKCISFAICINMREAKCDLLFSLINQMPTYKVQWAFLNKCRLCLRKNGWHTDRRRKYIRMVTLDP